MGKEEIIRTMKIAAEYIRAYCPNKTILFNDNGREECRYGEILAADLDECAGQLITLKGE